MRLLLVIHRFGPEIVGGAERHALEYVRRLAARGHETTVATTRARDYRTWRDEYDEGESTLEPGASLGEGADSNDAAERGAPIRLLRFGVARERAPRRFEFLSRLAHRWPRSRRLSSAWMRAQGPDSPALAAWVAENARSFDAVILFNYLYYSTWSCMPACADRALLVPLAHDEPPLRLAAYADLFRAPRALLWSSRTELELLRERFGDGGLPAGLFQGGTGLDFGDDGGAAARRDPSDALREALAATDGSAWLALQSPEFAAALRGGRFFLSLGRIAEGKDADLLAALFADATGRARALAADSPRATPPGAPPSLEPSPSVAATLSTPSPLSASSLSASPLSVSPTQARAADPGGAASQVAGASLPPLLMVGPMELRDPSSVERAPSVLASNGAAPERVARALRGAALATLHASRHESLNLAAAESLAAGTPVLSRSASLATVELVEESGCGAVWRDAAELAPLLISEARRDAASRAERAARAIAYARAKFDWERTLDRLEEAVRFAATPPRS
jgi:glycosyltransferase involved in cell wall biosynthesis